MNTALAKALDQQLQRHGRNTIEDFCQRVTDVINRHSPQHDLTEAFTAWRASDYSAEYLQVHIHPTLIHLRNELSRKQYRCDGNLDQLESVAQAFKNGSALQHVQDTIFAQVFILWCDTFLTLSREEATVV